MEWKAPEVSKLRCCGNKSIKFWAQNYGSLEIIKLRNFY